MSQPHPEIRLIRKPQVLLKYPYSHTQFQENIARGVFPKPVPIGRRAVAWVSHEVDAVIAALVAGKSEAEIRELVRGLEAARSGAQ